MIDRSSCLSRPGQALVLAIALLLATSGQGRAMPWSGAGAESLNVEILGHYAVESATGVWSCAAYVHQNGSEFGLLGADSLYIVDLRIPREPRRASVVPPAGPLETDPYYVSVVVRGVYAYAAGRHGPIRIIDLSNPFLPVVRGEIPKEDFCACSCGRPCDDPEQAVIEGLFIDERGILYVAGIECGEGFHMYDLAADPIQPPWLCHAHTRPGSGYSYYAHDVYARDSVLFVSCSRESEVSPPRWDIMDGTVLCPEVAGPCGDGELPRLISTFRHDGPELHAHSAWRLDDPNYLMTCDEKRDGHIRIWDISDLTAPVPAGEYHPDHTCHSVHLAVAKGETGYAAWYNTGIQIFTLEDPEHPMQIGYYAHPTRWRAGPEERCCDPTDGGEANCAGVAMIDPFFPSGIFIAAEVDGGLLVGRFAYGPIAAPENDAVRPGREGADRLRVLGTAGGREIRIEWQADPPQPGRGAIPELEIFSASGKRIVRLRAVRSGSAGLFEFRWDGRDHSGQPVPAGIYFARPVGAAGALNHGKLLLLD